jgi:hypothetical protein
MVSFLSNAVESTQCLIKAVVSSVEIKSTLFSTLSGALKNGAVGKKKNYSENSHPLRRKPAGFTAQDCADFMQVNRSVISHYLNRLCDDGYLRKENTRPVRFYVQQNGGKRLSHLA